MLPLKIIFKLPFVLPMTKFEKNVLFITVGKTSINRFLDRKLVVKIYRQRKMDIPKVLITINNKIEYYAIHKKKHMSRNKIQT